jgi:signal transduction histidine kinase
VDTLTRLLDAMRCLAPIHDETSVTQAIADAATRLFEASGAALFIRGGDTAVLAAVSGSCAAVPVGMRLSFSQAPFRTEVPPGTLTEVTTSDDVPEALADQRPACVMPLSLDGHVAGWLWLRSVRPSAVAPAAAQVFAVQAAGALATTRQFRAAAEAEQQQDDAVATLAHELRTPLAAITHALAALDRFAVVDAQVIGLREIIGRQTRHLVRLVEDYLDVARIRYRKAGLRRQPVDLRDIVRYAVEALAAAGRSREHEVRARVPETAVVVTGDATRLEQVVRNLLDNAVKYSPPHTTVDVSVEQAAGEAILRVQDEGIGITPALLPRLFEPFAQGDRAGPSAAGGLGLGLPLVRAIVEQHGGMVTAHSGGAGQGSLFVVRLPRDVTTRPG